MSVCLSVCLSMYVSLSVYHMQHRLSVKLRNVIHPAPFLLHRRMPLSLCTAPCMHLTPSQRYYDNKLWYQASHGIVLLTETILRKHFLPHQSPFQDMDGCIGDIISCMIPRLTNMGVYRRGFPGSNFPNNPFLQ